MAYFTQKAATSFVAAKISKRTGSPSLPIVRSNLRGSGALGLLDASWQSTIRTVRSVKSSMRKLQPSPQLSRPNSRLVTPSSTPLKGREQNLSPQVAARCSLIRCAVDRSGWLRAAASCPSGIFSTASRAASGPRIPSMSHCLLGMSGYVCSNSRQSSQIIIASSTPFALGKPRWLLRFHGRNCV